MNPLQQLKENMKHYELSAIAFTEDAARFHKKAEEAWNITQKYKEAITKLESES